MGNEPARIIRSASDVYVWIRCGPIRLWSRYHHHLHVFSFADAMSKTSASAAHPSHIEMFLHIIKLILTEGCRTKWSKRKRHLPPQELLSFDITNAPQRTGDAQIIWSFNTVARWWQESWEHEGILVACTRRGLTSETDGVGRWGWIHYSRQLLHFPIHKLIISLGEIISVQLSSSIRSLIQTCLAENRLLLSRCLSSMLTPPPP